MLRGHQGGCVLRRRRLRGRGVAFCQTGVGIGRLRRAVHPGGCYSVLVVAPGYLTHRSIMGIIKSSLLKSHFDKIFLKLK